jgi:hypothetical protein
MAAADSLRADTAWFEKNRHELEREYAGEYIAIVDQRVVDHDPAFDPLARRMFEQYGDRGVTREMSARDNRDHGRRSPCTVTMLAKNDDPFVLNDAV